MKHKINSHRVKINSQRLSRYITSRECINATNSILDRISGMTKEQFEIIRLDLETNVKEKRKQIYI